MLVCRSQHWNFCVQDKLYAQVANIKMATVCTDIVIPVKYARLLQLVHIWAFTVLNKLLRRIQFQQSVL